jgi:hypothetical protein
VERNRPRGTRPISFLLSRRNNHTGTSFPLRAYTQGRSKCLRSPVCEGSATRALSPCLWPRQISDCQDRATVLVPPPRTLRLASSVLRGQWKELGYEPERQQFFAAEKELGPVLGPARAFRRVDLGDNRRGRIAVGTDDA